MEIIRSEEGGIIVKKKNLETLNSVEGIAFIFPIVKYKVFNDLANEVSGTKEVRKRLNLFGKGQVIAIADTGLDIGVDNATMYPDLVGRIINITNKIRLQNSGV